jgi:hypothetical protein
VGLLANALLKVPMQFLILMVGVAVCVFHQFERPPLLWNGVAEAQARKDARASAQLDGLDAKLGRAFEDKRAGAHALVAALAAHDEPAAARARATLRDGEREERALREQARAIVRAHAPGGQASDADSIFLSFVLKRFPPGLVGLLLAVIICAALSATASALNALGATTVVDFYKPLRPGVTDAQSLFAARLFTIGWGLVAVSFAAFASLLDNLIQAVNILGSIFYGPMLGVFLVGFLLPRVRGTAAFAGTLIAQAFVVALWLGTSLGFLWYNVAGCAAVLLGSLAVQAISPARR